MRTKELSLSVVALATLCLVGCERSDRSDRTDRPELADAAEPRPAPANPSARGPSDPAARERAEQGVRNPEYSPHEPGGVDSLRHTDENPPPAQPGTNAAQGPLSRSEFIAASRRRLAELDRELAELETRSRERGREIRGEMRSEMREEKRRLERELDEAEKQTDEAWSQMKDGFADALERLEGQIRKVRKDIDPDT